MPRHLQQPLRWRCVGQPGARESRLQACCGLCPDMTRGVGHQRVFGHLHALGRWLDDIRSPCLSFGGSLPSVKQVFKHAQPLFPLFRQALSFAMSCTKSFLGHRRLHCVGNTYGLTHFQACSRVAFAVCAVNLTIKVSTPVLPTHRIGPGCKVLSTVGRLCPLMPWALRGPSDWGSGV